MNLKARNRAFCYVTLIICGSIIAYVGMIWAVSRAH